MGLRIEAPSLLQGVFNGVAGGFGPVFNATGLWARRLVWTQPADGCVGPTEYLQPTHRLQDAFAVIQRGGCTFVEKVLAAQRSGAAAVIVANVDDQLFTMSGIGDPAIDRRVRIPRGRQIDGRRECPGPPGEQLELGGETLGANHGRCSDYRRFQATIEWVREYVSVQERCSCPIL